jgi:hypothetical protein
VALSRTQPFLNSLTLFNDSLTVYKVAREFEFTLLQQAVSDVRDSGRRSVAGMLILLRPAYHSDRLACRTLAAQRTL